MYTTPIILGLQDHTLRIQFDGVTLPPQSDHQGQGASLLLHTQKVPKVVRSLSQVMHAFINPTACVAPCRSMTSTNQPSTWASTMLRQVLSSWRPSRNKLLPDWTWTNKNASWWSRLTSTWPNCTTRVPFEVWICDVYYLDVSFQQFCNYILPIQPPKFSSTAQLSD